MMTMDQRTDGSILTTVMLEGIRRVSADRLDTTSGGAVESTTVKAMRR